MKWKLTFRFVSTIISVVIIVVLINILAIIGVFIANKVYVKDNKYLMEPSPEDYVRNFDKYILNNEKDIYVSDEGKKDLDNMKNWIQVLDEDGREVYSYKKPKNTRLKYTPVDMISIYKNRGGLNIFSTMFVGEKLIKNKGYSYIIGFPMNEIDKQVIVYKTYEMKKIVKNSIVSVLLVDSIIALIFGYLFSRGLTKPLGNIINGVGKLGEGNYNVHYSPKGIYSDVYHNLNNLSNTLKCNEIERKKLDQMREEWIANISHDIKTPLSSIKGYSEVLSDDEYDFSKEEIKSYANVIGNKSNYIKELVDDLNLTQKLKNKNSIINKKEINIVQLVKDSIIDILNDSKYSQRNINFICEENIILKELDRTLMKRVINNILFNAIIHNDPNVKIEVKIIKNEKIHIFIKDNGKGITEAELKYIFQRYYRGTNTGERHKGSGLGMAIAKEIIISHGGEIKISSILKEGTEIEIVL